jgi:hypothetical protein
MRNEDSSVGNEGESKEWTESERSPSRHERSFMTRANGRRGSNAKRGATRRRWELSSYARTTSWEESEEGKR